MEKESNMPKIAIIGGTGVYNPNLLSGIQQENVDTPHGEIEVIIGHYHDYEVAFIPRHGKKHAVPPHLINYRANLAALHKLGVENVLATAAVGSLNYAYAPGSFLLPDQFLDFTKNRESTFFVGGDMGVRHCDMTVPYCPSLRAAVETAGQNMGVPISNGGVYVCTEGTRFETAAEINMFKQLGGDVVGMTSVPEVCLARELGMCYVSIAVITNFAAGISPMQLTHAEVVQVMEESITQLQKLIMSSLFYINSNEDKSCGCNAFTLAEELSAK